MKRIALLAAFLTLPIAAFAAEAPVEKKAGLPSTMTINDCLLIFNALNELDKPHQVIIGNPPNQQVVNQSNEFTGNFRINVLAHNLHALTTLQQDGQAEQQKIIRDMLAKMPAVKVKDKDGKETGETKPATEIPPGTPEAIEYDKRMKELTGAPCMADLAHFKESDLNLDKNPIPGWALANMEKIRDK